MVGVATGQTTAPPVSVLECGDQRLDLGGAMPLELEPLALAVGGERELRQVIGAEFDPPNV